MLPQLNFPDYDFRIERRDGRPKIWDAGRKIWLVLTPEEWVRQHWLQFLIVEKGFPASLIACEKVVKINGMEKRFDILAGHPPILLIECKAPAVKITQATADQALRYNLSLKVPYLALTNGIEHFMFRVDVAAGKIEAVAGIPNYADLVR